MANTLSYDPSEYGSVEEAARARAAMDQEFGMPCQPYANNQMGRLVNEHHAQQQTEMNNEFGWCGTTPGDLRRRWGLD